MAMAGVIMRGPDGIAIAGAIALAFATMWGCGQSTPADAPADASSGSADDGDDDGVPASTSGADDDGGGDDSSSDDGTPMDEPGDDRLWLTHAFGKLSMQPYEDDDSRCISWTLDNVLPVYAQAVLASNEGYFHHSNWFVVPDDVYDGPDGYWNCADRGYSEIDAGQKGTVLFAQSTQSYVEEQKLADGAVIKIPARSRIVAGIHTLNATGAQLESGLWISINPIHPADVTTVVVPLGMQYKALDIPAQTEARFTADCDLAFMHGVTTLGQPLEMTLHYILPHYHYLGNYFDVSVVGGELDGQSVFQIDGFVADASGKTFDPPLPLTGATGLRLTCGYDNWKTENVTWGNGDGEMCVLLALVDNTTKIGTSVDLGNHLVDVQDGIQMYEGTCLGVAVNKKEDQSMPTEQEILAPLYLPPVDPADQGLPPIPACIDADRDAAPAGAATLSSIKAEIFAPGCSFGSCHGASAAGHLDLTASNLHAELLDHTPFIPGNMPLVTPGDPENSWLYRVLADCEPEVGPGLTVSHMPKNAPKLLDNALVAKVHAWITAGAPNN